MPLSYFVTVCKTYKDTETETQGKRKKGKVQKMSSSLNFINPEDELLYKVRIKVICFSTRWIVLAPVSRKSRNVSGDISLSITSKWRRSETRNVAVMLFFIPFKTYQKTSFTGWAGRSFTNRFSGQKSFWDFQETGPWWQTHMLAIMVICDSSQLIKGFLLFIAGKSVVL